MKSVSVLLIFSVCLAVVNGADGAPFNLADLAFQRSWSSGSKDAAGKEMNATEIMHLVPHGGKLYAATSQWMESDPKTPRASAILVLDRPEGKWRVDHQFNTDALRLVSMREVTFTTDAKGKAIKPVAILLAGPDATKGGDGKHAIYSLNDATGRWERIILGDATETTTTRAIGFHRDSVTGVDIVFAGVSGVRKSTVGDASLGVIPGVYDPTRRGRVRWGDESEVKVPAGERVMGFAEANGKVYCATSRHIYLRHDGAAPRWEEVYFNRKETSPVGIRGLTGVPNPSGRGEVLIFVALSSVRTLDPSNGYADSLELDIPKFVSKQLGVPVTWVLAAYNRFTPYRAPGSDSTVWLFGFESIYPKRFFESTPKPGVGVFVRDAKEPKLHFAVEARYMIREMTGSEIHYRMGTIADSEGRALVAPRDIVPSPFPNDAALYFGGFDCNDQPSHHTGWIYRGEFRGGN
jgi:poly(A) polymerase